MDEEKGRVGKRGRGKHEDLAVECFSQSFWQSKHALIIQQEQRE